MTGVSSLKAMTFKGR